MRKTLQHVLKCQQPNMYINAFGGMQTQKGTSYGEYEYEAFMCELNVDKDELPKDQGSGSERGFSENLKTEFVNPEMRECLGYLVQKERELKPKIDG